jgi:NADP-dependent 3-hydroxy acid dehydrogenase YdfG
MNIAITGASRGIGQAIAEKFAREKHAVIVCGRDEKKLEAVRQSCPGISTFACDISKKGDIRAFGEFILQTFGHLDILVNNGGIFLPGKITEEADGQLETVMDTNLFSAYHLTRQLVPSMIARQSGHIFNMCSVASLKAYENGGSYSISKFALHGFSKTLREELKAQNIKVTAVFPGATLTDSWAGSGIPEERFIKPEDIADMIYAVSQLSASAVVEEIVIRPQLGDV